jgi:hypothetical protein
MAHYLTTSHAGERNQTQIVRKLTDLPDLTSTTQDAGGDMTRLGQGRPSRRLLPRHERPAGQSSEPATSSVTRTQPVSSPEPDEADGTVAGPDWPGATTRRPLIFTARCRTRRMSGRIAARRSRGRWTS